ncbi:MAG: insulinase family protein [Peptococcaceae bacterium]|nr:insulinase family protein [Peptococcaceae bacterium]
MQINDVISGFRLVEERPVPETDSTGRLFVHEKTGARLLQLANNDSNKVFGIGFRTPSANSTGVAHILEHSVLNGSKKYRTKEPFMDLARTSLNTFLNAMTFSDKTIYPVASQNDKDFDHLMDVYLDAVFNPAIYTTKEIFLQEGWHYHIEKPEDPITYRGVVYNEMRGALSSADAQVTDEILASLYPDTIYGQESGGNPYEIPELSYEAFLDFHRKLYHPCNSYIFIYGDGDIEKFLAHINDNYLASIEPLTVDSTIAWQEAFVAPKEEEVYYSVAPDADTEGKDILSYAVSMGSRRTPKDLFVEEVLSEVLVNAQSGVVKNALLAAGIGEDISAFTSDGLQIPFGIVAKDTDAARRDEFVEIIEKTLTELVKKGIDKDQLLAAVNKMEYSLREANGYTTRGIIYYIDAMETWLYDGSPFDALCYNAPLAELRADVESDFYERYIKERILDNPHKSILVARPDAGMNDAKDAAVEAKLAEFKAGLSEQALGALIDETQGLLARQNSEDTPEQKATIPHLEREDVTGSFPVIPCNEENIHGATVLHHPLFTAGINYVDMLLSLDHVDVAELPYLSLLTSLIGAVDTQNYSYSALATAEYLTSGGISITSRVIQDIHEPDTFHHKLVVSSKTLSPENTAGFLELATEQLERSDFSDKKRFREVVQMLKSQTQAGIFQQGHTVVAGRVTAYHSAYSRFNEFLNGLDFLFFLQELDNHFDERFDETRAKVEDLYSRLLTRKDMLVSVTCDDESYASVRPVLANWIGALPDAEYPHADWQVPVEVLNEGIQSSANVQYVAKGADIGALGVGYSGVLEVLSNVLSNEYLYNNVRAKGGAYGQGIRFSRNGSVSCYSYRDPNLENTIAIYDAMADWLENLEMDEQSLTNYIIGVMNRFNPVMTARAKGVWSLTSRVNGACREDLLKAQEEALAATLDALKSYAPALRQAMAENHLCVLGGSERIKQAENLFGRVIKLDN